MRLCFRKQIITNTVHTNTIGFDNKWNVSTLKFEIIHKRQQYQPIYNKKKSRQAIKVAMKCLYLHFSVVHPLSIHAERDPSLDLSQRLDQNLHTFHVDAASESAFHLFLLAISVPKDVIKLLHHIIGQALSIYC